ncbi:Hut1p [Sugiyamaella lignohabitans]|uniref:UDP-galactose transporter homolog 1 n=1 Tax=Sugiyamaella lignohabitans TaxID=796027 RepID=A0A167D5V7_9ASCO|nr:Hut1p [Sugiyamaella lignohabitans]ANB12521.1 Hut1p [Sugiyamaella lignohabitans]
MTQTVTREGTLKFQNVSMNAKEQQSDRLDLKSNPISDRENGAEAHSATSGNSIVSMIICVLGIYASFLTWAVLQERISTTPYGADGRVFKASLVINTVQSVLAAVVGFIYLEFKKKGDDAKYNASIFPNSKTVQQYLLVAVCQSLASPFAYASLSYVDYLTLLLAKSCKLLPVMTLHLTIYRRRYPLYKYMIVLAITAGVCMFSVFHSSTKAKSASSAASSASSSSSLFGFLLLGINLFLDGFYNTTQDHMFHTNKSITGPHMMCGLNAISGALTALVLISPFTNQLSEAIDFISLHPRILYDILLFGICGALGQVFIFHTLEKYGSIILVTVTVTRKMFSMLLSVIWFNHKLQLGQWAGVFLVFAGIGFEAWLKYSEKKVKTK